MSKIRFTKNQIKQLSKNKYILKISEKAITYSNEFKIYFITEYQKGKTSRMIFEEANFDVHIIGISRIDCASRRWRNAYKKYGVLGLNYTRKNNSGRHLQRELTKDEIISRKNAEIEFLKAEVELLKKLELQERRVIRGKIAPFKIFKLIESIVQKLVGQNIPGKVLLTDITYLPYSNSNMAYLSTIKDSSTNEILAYKVSDKITIDITLDTIKNLVSNTEVTLSKNVFIHSDQGSHYTSPKFQKLLKSLNIGQSMSRRGNCWDNAPQESFFGHMKDEITYRTCETLPELEKIIKNYIDYYNNYRCQWNLKKLTPVQYKSQLLNI